MPKLNPIPAKRMIKILRALGFVLLHSKGSHHFFFNRESGRSTVVPIHGGEDLSVGILKEILRDIELTIEEYEKMRREI
jgi:predicted RNA binding protein YcfA (HicA-like mRNA interferase family)